MIYQPALGVVPLNPKGEDVKESLEIIDESKPVFELGLLSGSRVVIDGQIVCESDAAKPCITLKFKAEEKKAYNYYSCNTCTLNWICEPCIAQCHKVHDVKEYLKGHVPQWACCYCLKKGCKLPNKNNPNVAAVLMID